MHIAILLHKTTTTTVITVTRVVCKYISRAYNTRTHIVIYTQRQDDGLVEIQIVLSEQLLEYTRRL